MEVRDFFDSAVSGGGAIGPSEGEETSTHLIGHFRSGVSSDPLSESPDTANLFSMLTASDETNATISSSPATQLLSRIPAQLKKSGFLGLSQQHSALLTTASQLEQHAFSSTKAPRASAQKNSKQPSDGSAQPQDALFWQSQLESGQLLRGAVVEVCSDGGAAWGTSIALRACAAAQKSSHQLGSQDSWCAFLDPSASLYAPGVAASGVNLKRLLVVRPDEESLSRVALRLVEARVFPLVVIDTQGPPGRSLELRLSTWARVVRRLSLALSGTQSTALLLTEKNAPRPLPLPCSQRLEVTRNRNNELTLSVPKNTHGSFLPPTKLPWPPPSASNALWQAQLAPALQTQPSLCGTSTLS